MQQPPAVRGDLGGKHASPAPSSHRSVCAGCAGGKISLPISPAMPWAKAGTSLCFPLL